MTMKVYWTKSSCFCREIFDVVGRARDGAALLHIAARANADVVITDFRMQGISGIEASSMLLQRGLCRAVILLTTYADLQLAQGARRAGILGFVLKVKAGEDFDPGDPLRVARRYICLLFLNKSAPLLVSPV